MRRPRPTCAVCGKECKIKYCPECSYEQHKLDMLLRYRRRRKNDKESSTTTTVTSAQRR
jgi:hypothetical protein